MDYKSKDSLFCTKKTIKTTKGILDLSYPKVMGIINATTDSFYENSRKNTVQDALVIAEKMISEGADILDIGGYSSRPGAEHISENEEMDRVIPIIESIAKNFPNIQLSIDTFRGAVAQESINQGATIINDISGGQLDPTLLEVVIKNKTPYVLMHIQGTPQNMQSHTDYKNIMLDIMDYFIEKIEFLKNKGIHDVILDLGFGFSKSLDQNYLLLKNLSYFRSLGVPLLAGVSRKSMIYKLLDVTPEEALNGTSVLHTFALQNGANILRAHDVKEAVEAIKLTEKYEAS